MPLSSHSSWLYHPHNSGWGVQILGLSLRSFLQTSVTSSLLGPNILLNTLNRNIWSICLLCIYLLLHVCSCTEVNVYVLLSIDIPGHIFCKLQLVFVIEKHCFFVN
jgi:hypothetical protein